MVAFRLALVAVIPVLFGAGLTVPAATAGPAVNGPAPAVRGAVAGVVKVCVKKRTGAMRQVSARRKCTRGERFVRWNLAGPAGRDGTNGTDGTDGSPGARGPSNAYRSAMTDQAQLTAGSSNLLSLDLPAGRYLIQGVVAILDPVGAGATPTALCRPVLDDVPISGAINYVRFGFIGDPTSLNNVVSAGVELSSAGTVSLQCLTLSAGYTMTAANGVLTAVEVETLT